MTQPQTPCRPRVRPPARGPRRRGDIEMTPATKPQEQRIRPPAWHAAFQAMMPAILRHARGAFCDRDPELREELVEEVLANCLVAFTRLVKLGKAELGYATPLAMYGVRQVREGRQVGARLNINDVSSAYCQIAKGLRVERLDRYDRQEGGWMEVLVEDRHAGPADTAAVRIDFPAWLATHRDRDRRVAEALAGGSTTGEVAGRFGISAARVSQLRGELKASWARFHGESLPE